MNTDLKSERARRERFPLKTRRRKLAEAALLFAVLFAPSIWMFNAIPPLWKDVDAYIQVTQPPGVGTILHYAPFYCFIARIPLYLGYAIDCYRTGAAIPGSDFFLHPTLSDTGVLGLLLLQHVALCGAAFYLITLAAQLFAVRLVLAVAWAINPLFYTFAHCVGSETLSMILLLMIAAVGLRIVSYRRNIPWKEWLWYGILLCLSILTRHINAVLAGLMFLAFFFLSLQRLNMIPFSHSRLRRRWRRLRARQDLKKAMLALAVGVSCLVFANLSLRVLSHAAHIPYHSRIGFTFLWRLKFLATLSPETRNELLDQVGADSSSPDAQKVIVLLHAWSWEEPNWDVLGFMQKAESSLFAPEGKAEDKKFNVALNAMAWGFLWPPKKVFLRAVTTDFNRSREVTIPAVVNHLFRGTIFFFSNPASMAGCATLSTFRDRSPAQIAGDFKKHSYFHRRKSVSYNAYFLFWFTSLALLALIAAAREANVSTVTSYAAALVLIGLAMMLGNCFFTEFGERYTLPMWTLTIVSASTLCGRFLELVLSGRARETRVVESGMPQVSI